MPQLPQFSLKKPVHTLLVSYIDTECGRTSQDQFAAECLAAGAEYIKRNDGFFHAVPVMEDVFKDNDTGTVYYSPDGVADFEAVAGTLLNTRGIRSKRMLIREASLWFLEQKGLLKITRTTILAPAMNSRASNQAAR